jgi:hypothetical protein
MPTDYGETFISFFVMFFIALTVDAMNIMIYVPAHYYLSKSVIISSLLMASNMLWAHQLIQYFYAGAGNKFIFSGGVALTLLLIYIMRTQQFIGTKDWLREMIPHHSVALTTTKKMLENNNIAANTKLYHLAKNIEKTQMEEIATMEKLLQE